MEVSQTKVHDETDADTLATPRRRNWPVYLLALLVIGLLLVGSGFGLARWLITDRPTSDSPEATFARQMARHHAQAVEMATIVRDRSSDQELRTLALDIMLTQQAQIGQMQGWLAAWELPLSSPVQTSTMQSSNTPMAGMTNHSQMIADHSQMPGMATQTQINQLNSLPIDEAEVSFLQLMIRHHQGGVTMARMVLAQTNRLEVRRLAQAIVQSQESEISYMRDLLRQRGIPAGAT